MSKKEQARDFILRCAAGDVRSAFDQYTSSSFIHHNAYFKGDRESLLVAMEEAAEQSPNKLFEIQRILEDGEMVAIHSKVQLTGNDVEIAVMHILLFEEGKIVELWDFGQSAPSEMVNENGMF